MGRSREAQEAFGEARGEDERAGGARVGAEIMGRFDAGRVHGGEHAFRVLLEAVGTGQVRRLPVPGQVDEQQPVVLLEGPRLGCEVAVVVGRAMDHDEP